MRRIVIVGGGIAAVRTAARLRSRGCADELLIVSGEAQLPYDRPPLSKEVLRGTRDRPTLQSSEQLAAADIKVRLDDPATGLDLERHVLLTRAGEVDFDVVVIATGAQPRRLPGLAGQVLRSWDDAVSLRARLTDGVRLGIIGAGLIGCEVAASARALGADVHLVDTLEAPMVRVVGPRFGAHLCDLHMSRGVHVHLSRSVTAVTAAGICLDGAELLEVDVVLQAVGSVPSCDWLKGSGLSVDNGVVCSADGRTSDPLVFAVGDVAAAGGRRAEHWTSAVNSADRVAAAILGKTAPPYDVPYWWSDQYEFKLQGLGTVAADGEVHLGRWGADARPVALYSRDGRLTGVAGISAAGAVMRLRNDIVSGTDVAEIRDRLGI